MRQYLTRRQFLGAAAIGLTAPISMDSPLAFPPDAPPVTAPVLPALAIPFGVAVAFGDELASLLGINSVDLAAQLATALSATSDAAFRPDIVNVAVMVTATPAPDAWQSIPLARIFLVPVVSPRLSAPNLPADKLAAVLQGAVGDWGSLGAYTNQPLELLTLRALADLEDARFLAPPERTFATLDALTTALLSRPGGLALVPLSALSPLLKPLAIGDMDAAAGHGPLDAYPLAVTLTIAVSPDAPAGTLNVVRAFADAYRTRPTPPSFNVLFLGDVIQGRDVHKRMLAAHDFQLPFRKVAPFTVTADLTLTDNECDYSDTIPNPVDHDPHTFSFVTHTAAVDGLRLAGVKGVSLANNHSMNTGRQGLIDTLAALSARGIVATGAGVNLAAAREPAIFSVKGVKVALLGYNGVSARLDGATEGSAGTVPMEMDILQDDMAKATARAGVVIPFFHWSVEYTSVPTSEQVRFAHAAIDMGASIVIGSHPHWVQATEVYKGKQIIYSLGNFVFDQEWSIETKQGTMAELLFLGNRVVGVRLIPILITDFSTPHIATPAEALPIFARIWTATDTLAKRIASV